MAATPLQRGKFYIAGSVLPGWVSLARPFLPPPLVLGCSARVKWLGLVAQTNMKRALRALPVGLLAGPLRLPPLALPVARRRRPSIWLPPPRGA